jgi:NosR/NirI family nitrous oxide reductase transcriptional regulator
MTAPTQRERRRASVGSILALIIVCLAPALSASGQSMPYQRPVDTAPQEKSIGNGYRTPAVQKPLPRDYRLQILDVVVLAGAMALSIWLVLKRRSRKGLVALAAGSVVYFGFYREGCVCPIGSIQNVTAALTDVRYSIPIVVTVTFFLPLVAAVMFGRVFCGGVCPLGAVQELVLLKPVKVPRKLNRVLGLLRYLYLGLAIYFVLKPAATRDFLICRFDPFVGFFRMSGAPYMLIAGGCLVLAAMFLGRPYCRYLCPYGCLLEWCSRLAGRGVTITPNKELDCGLCAGACPYGAIEKMRAVRSDCLYCARCYASCPRGAKA